MPDDPAGVMRAHFEAWRTKDFDALSEVLADDVTFRGPMGTADGADECRAGIEHMSSITTDVRVQRMLVDGPDVLTWFDLHTSAAPPVPVANWSRVEDGRVRRIRVAFDPRPLLSPSGE